MRQPETQLEYGPSPVAGIQHMMELRDSLERQIIASSMLSANLMYLVSPDVLERLGKFKPQQPEPCEEREFKFLARQYGVQLIDPRSVLLRAGIEFGPIEDRQHDGTNSAAARVALLVLAVLLFVVIWCG